MLKVAKFGGSSLADAVQFAKVKAIIESDPTRRLIVVSAPGKRHSDDSKVTDLLYLCHAHLQYSVSCEPIFRMIEQRYLEICDRLQLKVDLEGEFEDVFSSLNKDIGIDYLVSRGEYFSAKVMAEYLGFTFADAKNLVLFDADGRLNVERTEAAIQAFLKDHDKVVLPGFYGSLPDGTIKVFSRGGSDISGALLAVGAGADIYENWTDVSGILMADPRVVENPRRIDMVTYSELRELAYMGANVIHEGAIYPARDKGIPINIRNTNEPENPGTTILNEKEVASLGESGPLISGIAGKKSFTVITIGKSIDDGRGMIRKALEVLEKYNVQVEHIPSGIDSFSIVVATSEVQPHQLEIVADINAVCQPSGVRIVDQIALIAVVGRNMVYRPGVSGRLFSALGDENINIRMIAQGSDEINIIVGVENKDYERTIRTIYNRFVDE